MNDNQAPVLYRPRQGAVLGGVCAGIAARWRVDPLLVRVAMVVLALWGGVGVAVYLTGLLGLSRDPGRPSFVERRLPFTRRWTQSARLAAVFLAFAAVLAVSQHGVGGFFVPLLVVAGVVWMGGRKSRVAPPAEPTPFERAAAAWQQRVAEHQSRYGAT
ncbi:MAG: PspC domain-containing protein, partial [Propionibacteriaceae bacterium]|nr:PspC domain-containing protein [Propionibacteriaceae bacterium]